MTPVRDAEGQVRWRVRVGPGELTCTACGETFPAGWNGCPRCNETPHRHLTQTTRIVPTVSYLQEGEWERA